MPKCYATKYHLNMHWDKVKRKERGGDLASHCRALKALKAPMVRLNQAGDLPALGKAIANYHVTVKSSNIKTGPIPVTTSSDCPDSCPMKTACTGTKNIDLRAARQLLEAASRSRIAWTYTHYKGARNRDRIAKLNQTKATVNWSADSLPEADTSFASGLPTVVIVDKHHPKTGTTKAGNRLIVCPAQTGKATCNTCGGGVPLCARKGRKYIIAFREH